MFLNNLFNEGKFPKKPKEKTVKNVTPAENMAGVGMEPHAREQSKQMRGYDKDGIGVTERMMPKSSFVGSKKNKLGTAGQWRNKGPKANKPARQGDLVGGAAESYQKKKGADGKACWKGYKYAGTKKGKDRCVPIGEAWEAEMRKVIRLLENK